MSIKIAPQQSLLDLAIQEYGNAAAAIQIAIDNDIAVTYVALPGEVINDTVAPVTQVTRYFASRGTRPVTQETKPQQLFENGLFDNGLFE